MVSAAKGADENVTRLSEGLALKVGDIDATRSRVHVRDSKGNRDRLVPLPTATLSVLRRFWQTHRNPQWLFPNRLGGLKAESAFVWAASAESFGGVVAMEPVRDAGNTERVTIDDHDLARIDEKWFRG